MEDVHILRDLFDEKIIRIINVFIKNPEKQFYLSEVSKLSGINVSTTFRTLNKFLEQGFVKTVVIGKVRLYQLERNEKTSALFKFLKKEESSATDEFLNKIKEFPRIKKIIEDSKSDFRANYLIVGDFIPVDRIERMANEIKIKHKFIITFAVISESQFEALRNYGGNKFSNKLVFERKSK
jgi:Fe2+ or Zn2+ uptake regulation protein